MIERKAKGEKIVSTDDEAPKATKAPDLMAALEESLAAVKGEPLAEGGAKKKAPAKKKKPAAKKKSSSSGSRAKSKS